MAEKTNDKKLMNRWIIVFGAIMIQVALGAIYAWSAFTTPLQGTDEIASEFAFNNFLPFSCQLIFQAIPCQSSSRLHPHQRMALLYI